MRLYSTRTKTWVLSGGCLVTLKGPAGIGKTRLALVGARAWHHETGRPAWFCDLSEVRGLEGLVLVVARTLGQGDSGVHVNRLGNALGGRGEMVVVLDNFEQLRHLASVMEQWRQCAPRTRFVVTSRTPLRLPAERVLEVTTLGREDAVALLVARAHQRGVELRDDPDVEALVEKLDRLPLALELAAGRLGVLSVHDVLSRLSPSLLRQGTADRHATLQDALAWSWSLLSAPERQGLAQLSVFVGGFTLEAAEEVLELPGASVLSVVALLVERSLVRVGADGRLGLLVQVQAFASVMLVDRVSVERRHGVFFAGLGTSRSLCTLWAHGGGESRRLLSRELDNLSTACRRAAERGDGVVAALTMFAAWAVLQLQGPLQVGLELAQVVVDLPTLSDDTVARAAQTLGSVLRTLGKQDAALAQLHVVLEVSHRVGDRASLLESFHNLAVLHSQKGDMVRARPFYERSLELCRALGDYEGARGHYDVALGMHREVGSRRSEGHVLTSLGNLHREQGRADEARAHYAAALVLAREIDHRDSEGVLLCNQGDLHVDLGNGVEAQGCYEDSLAVARAIGNRSLEGHILGQLARVRASDGDGHEALALLDAGEELLRSVGASVFLAQLLTIRAEANWLSGDLEGARAALREACSVDPNGPVVVDGTVRRLQRLFDGPPS